MGLSVAIITKNEAINIGRTLTAVCRFADEIVVVDSGSTDDTVNIAMMFGAKVFTEEWKGYGLQKNSAIEKCTNEWILNIDADEVVSDELAHTIMSIVSGKNAELANKYDVFKVNRCSVCFGKEIKYGGWSNDYIIRLFRKGIGAYNDNVVHENFIYKPDALCYNVNDKLYHHTYRSLTDYLTKYNKYTTESATQLVKSGKKVKPSKVVLNPIANFIKFYFVKRGFLDGIEGFILASFSALYSGVKYYKALEMMRASEQDSKVDIDCDRPQV